MWGEGGNRTLVEAIGGDPLRVLHGEEEYEYHGFIRPGDLITVESNVPRFEGVVLKVYAFKDEG